MAANDCRPPLGPIFDAFGVPVTVTRPIPDEIPIVTTGIWVSPLTLEGPLGTEVQRSERQYLMALSRTAVPTVPRGTIVDAPERLGEADQRWRVDGTEQADADIHRVLVVPDPEGEL